MSISTTHCPHSGGTTLRQGLCPFPSPGCSAEPETHDPSCQCTGFGMAGRAHAQTAGGSSCPSRDQCWTRSLLAPLGKHPAWSCALLAPGIAMAYYGLISLNDFLSLNEHSWLRKEWKLLSSHHSAERVEGLTRTEQLFRW